MKRAKIFLLFIVIVIIILISNSNIQAKYVIDRNIVAAKLDIDRTKPTGIVNYSTQEITNSNIIATVYLSEPIKEVDGWEISEDKLTLTKEYEHNVNETITIVDQSGNEGMIEVKIDNIDKDKPLIELVNIDNTNMEYTKYANNSHTITATIRITDMKLNTDIDTSLISIIVGNNQGSYIKYIKFIKQTEEEVLFDLVLDSIEGNGKLIVFFPKDFVSDIFGNSTSDIQIDTGILIDNICPLATYTQEILDSGKVKAIISSNEEIRNIEEWNNFDNKLFNKIFPSNVSYNMDVYDYAQNKSTVEVNVTNATFIILTYAAHNSEIGWTYGLGNYDIAGKTAVESNPKYKIEALAFRITGKVDSNFVRIRGYVHSFWNNLSDYGKCNNTGYKYKLGEAPNSSANLYYSMASSELSTINGNKYIQIGGSGINMQTFRDYYGNNPIPINVVYDENYIGKYPYGVSELQMQLADYSELSIVYQILVNDYGWLKVATNGNITTAGKDLPMSAIRVAIIPNSEKEKVVEQWNKDIGTYKVE